MIVRPAPDGTRDDPPAPPPPPALLHPLVNCSCRWCCRIRRRHRRLPLPEGRRRHRHHHHRCLGMATPAFRQRFRLGLLDPQPSRHPAPRHGCCCRTNPELPPAPPVLRAGHRDHPDGVRHASIGWGMLSLWRKGDSHRRCRLPPPPVPHVPIAEAAGLATSAMTRRLPGEAASWMNDAPPPPVPPLPLAGCEPSSSAPPKPLLLQSPIRSLSCFRGPRR